VALGDEGGGNDSYANGQRIDRDLFAGLLRIERDHQLFGILHGWRSNRIGHRIVQPSGCPGVVKRGGLLMLGVGF
jgi:hypothetical protein